jgi:hypothetical protein
MTPEKDCERFDVVGSDVVWSDAGIYFAGTVERIDGQEAIIAVTQTIPHLNNWHAGLRANVPIPMLRPVAGPKSGRR